MPEVNSLIQERVWVSGKYAKYFGLVVVLSLAGCESASTNQPTPEAAKRFLKLRGYEFDEKSFFKAAEDGDLMAVNGFISAGINVNARDDSGDTVLTAAAAR